jgi:hypothetical protein
VDIETLKQPYRNFRRRAKKVLRRMRGDLESIVGSRHPDRARLFQLRDRHAGQTGFLVGSGPSVRTEDLDRLAGRLTFCCNRFYLAYDRTILRPTYLCSADPFMIQDFGEEIISRGQSIPVLMSVLRPELKGEYLWVELDSEEDFSFSRNILRPIHPGSATLIAALQIGYWMGIRHFVLYGVDHSFPRETKQYNVVGTDGKSNFVVGEGNHFIPNYRSGKPWSAPWIDTIEAAFPLCDRQLRSEGGWLINATRSTQLPEIERVPFEEALERAASIGSREA